MDRIIHAVVFGIVLVAFAMFNAAIIDNIGQAQLDITYTCQIVYSPAERVDYCRNELAGFGHLLDRQGTHRQYAALASL